MGKAELDYQSSKYVSLLVCFRPSFLYATSSLSSQYVITIFSMCSLFLFWFSTAVSYVCIHTYYDEK